MNSGVVYIRLAMKAFSSENIQEALRQRDEQLFSEWLERSEEIAHLELDGISLILQCLYHQMPSTALLLADVKMNLDLHESAALGWSDRIKKLTEHGLMLNQYGKDGQTALLLSCKFGQVESAKWLLTLGADPNLPGDDILREHPIQAAAGSNQLQIMQILLSYGANVNSVRADQLSALHIAASEGYINMCRWLLENGANPLLKTDSGETPGDLARSRGQKEILTMLF